MSPKTLVKPKNTKAESADDEPCIHHWIIDPPDGQISMGRCKRCGQEREFYNYVACSQWDNESSFSVRRTAFEDDVDEEPTTTTSGKKKRR